jgi:hypothetical protein
MSSRTVSSLWLVLTLGLGTGCDVFSPDLGDTPFLCEPPGSGDKRCPDGYDAVDLGARCECRSGGGGDGADSGPTGCNNDSAFEPNNDIGNATQTAIGAGSTSAVFDKMAICPATDVDVFRVSVPNANTTLDVRVSFDPSVGVLGVNVLNQSGSLVPNGMGTMTGNQVQAKPILATSGVYYVQVVATSGQNNYSVQMIAQ